MTKKVFNMAGGLHSAAAYSALENRAYGSCAASLDSFACSAGAGMTIKIAAGDGLISTTGNFARRIQSDAEETVNVSAASPSYSRIDAVVAYIDNAIAPTTSVIDNTNGILNFACVAGTAASSPVAPTAAAIQAAIGAGNDYVVLYEVTVPSGATSMNNAVFNRKVKTLSVLDLAMIPDKLITGAKIADGTITSDNVDFATLSWYSERTNDLIIANCGAYNYKKVDGVEINIDVKQGEKYVVFGSVTLTPTQPNEVYLIPYANDQNISAGVLNSNVSAYTNLSVLDQFVANATGTVTFSLRVGTGGNANTGVTIRSGTSLFVQRIA